MIETDFLNGKTIVGLFGQHACPRGSGWWCGEGVGFGTDPFKPEGEGNGRNPSTTPAKKDEGTESSAKKNIALRKYGFCEGRQDYGKVGPR